MNLEKIVTAKAANQNFSKTLREADIFGGIVITKSGVPAYILQPYTAYLRERNDKIMRIDEFKKEARANGVWVLGKNILTAAILGDNASETEKDKAYTATKVVIKENGVVDIITIHGEVPSLRCFTEDQITIEEVDGKITLTHKGRPYNALIFNEEEETKARYLKLFFGGEELKREELERFQAIAEKYNLPQILINPQS